MSQLYLPLAHTEADLVLAGQIAETIDSAELYVTWTSEQGQAFPEVVAELRPAAPHWTDALAFFFQAIRELWAGFLSQPPAKTHGRVAGEPAQRRKPAAGEAAA